MLTRFFFLLIVLLVFLGESVQAQEGVDSEALGTLATAFSHFNNQSSYRATYRQVVDTYVTVDGNSSHSELDYLSAIQVQRKPDASSDFTVLLDQNVLAEPNGQPVTTLSLQLELTQLNNISYGRYTHAPSDMGLPSDWVNLTENPAAIPIATASSPEAFSNQLFFPLNESTVLRIDSNYEAREVFGFPCRQYGIQYRMDGLLESGILAGHPFLDYTPMGISPETNEQLIRSSSLWQMVCLIDLPGSLLDGLPVENYITGSINTQESGVYLEIGGVPITINQRFDVIGLFSAYGSPISIFAPNELPSIPLVADPQGAFWVVNAGGAVQPPAPSPETADLLANSGWYVYVANDISTTLLAQSVPNNSGAPLTIFDWQPGRYVVWLASGQGTPMPSSNPIIVNIAGTSEVASNSTPTATLTDTPTPFMTSEVVGNSTPTATLTDTPTPAQLNTGQITLTVDAENRITRPDNLPYTQLCWEIYRYNEGVGSLSANNELTLDLRTAMVIDLLSNPNGFDIEFIPATYSVYLTACENGNRQIISNTVTLSYFNTGSNLASTNEVTLTFDVLDSLVKNIAGRPSANIDTLVWQVYLQGDLVLSEAATGAASLDLRQILREQLQVNHEYRVWLGTRTPDGAIQPISNEVVARFGEQEVTPLQPLPCLEFQAQVHTGTYGGVNSVNVSSVVIMVHGVETSTAAYDPWIERVFWGEEWHDALKNVCIIGFNGGRYPLIQGSSIVGERSDLWETPHPLSLTGTWLYGGGNTYFSSMGPAVWTGVEKLKQTVARVRYYMGMDIPITIVSHSQGTVVTLAALEEGMSIDNWILMGSPINRAITMDASLSISENTNITKAVAQVKGYVINFYSDRDLVVGMGAMDGIGNINLVTRIGGLPSIPSSDSYTGNFYNLHALKSDGFEPDHGDWWGNPSWLLESADANQPEMVQDMLAGYVINTPPPLKTFTAEQMTSFFPIWDYSQTAPCDIVPRPSLNCTVPPSGIVAGKVSGAYAWFGNNESDYFSDTLYLTPGMQAGPFFDDKTHGEYQISCSQGQVYARLQTATGYDFEGAGTDWQLIGNTLVSQSHNVSLSPQILYVGYLDATYWLQIENPGPEIAVCSVTFSAYLDRGAILDLAKEFMDITLLVAQYAADCVLPDNNPFSSWNPVNWELLDTFDWGDCF